MIFMCDKKCQTANSDRDDEIRQQPPSQFQKQTETEVDLSSPTGAKREPY